MNVCHFGFSLSLISGHSKPAFELAHYQNKCGVKVKLLSSELGAQYESLHQQLLEGEQLSVDTYRPFHSALDFAANGSNKAIREILEWADIVHVYGPHSLFLLRKCTSSFNAKIVLSINSVFKISLRDMANSGLSSFRNLVNLSYVGSLLPNKFFSLAISKANATICWTQFMQERVKSIGVADSCFIPVGVNIDSFHFTENTVGNDFVFLYLGYLASARGVNDLLNAFEIVNQKWSSTKLIVVHTGLHPSEQSMFLKRIRNSRSSKSIELMGFVTDLSEVINRANVVVLPFRTNIGYSQPPLTVLEALAHGRPVITTTSGCLPELVRNGYNGFCIQPSDPLLLAKFMLKMREANMDYMSRNAREYVRNNHNWSEICQSTVNIYNEVLSKC